MDIREITEKKVFSYMEEHFMVSPRDRIVAGVSGGADSVCLYFLLLAYAGRVPVDLSVVHVNHGLREDAAEDARFVEALCAENGIPFYLENADVCGIALREKCSLEDAGRRARYGAFLAAARKLGGARVAVAHNADDNAETMLFHLFRGSGVKGLCGIPPVRGDAGGTKIIRPVLCLERGEIEAYLRERGIPWRTDATNEQDGYARNRIRHHILPYAGREVAGGAVGHMCRTADMLRETEDFLEGQTREALDRCLKEAPLFPGEGGETAAGPGRYVLDAGAFLGCHGALRKRMIYDLAKRLSPTGKDISAVHVRDVLTLFAREANRSVSLPFGITARRQYGEVILERGRGEAMPGGGEASRADVPGGVGPVKAISVEVPSQGEILDIPLVYGPESMGRIELTVFFIKKGQEVPKNKYTKWFDCDKIEESVVIRSRCPGDYLTISDNEGNIRHKSLKDYMVTEKIPRQQRDRVPVVAAGNHVLWLVGRRISEYFKVDGNTQRILQIKWLREK